MCNQQRQPLSHWCHGVSYCFMCLSGFPLNQIGRPARDTNLSGKGGTEAATLMPESGPVVVQFYTIGYDWKKSCKCPAGGLCETASPLQSLLSPVVLFFFPLYESQQHCSHSPPTPVRTVIGCLVKHCVCRRAVGVWRGRVAANVSSRTRMCSVKRAKDGRRQRLPSR